MSDSTKRIGVYILTGVIVTSPIIHGDGPHEELKVTPLKEPHHYHAEFSTSAHPLTVTAVTNVPEGPNFRIEVKPALLSVTGHAPDLILSG